MSVAYFNVGGRPFAISADLLARHPSSKLALLASNPRSYVEPGLFLDHNPEAFSVALDYVRYGSLMVPPSVSIDVLRIVTLDLLGIQLPAATAGFGVSATQDDLTGLTRLPTVNVHDRPPSYSDLVGGPRISKSDSKGGLIAISNELNVTLDARLDSLVEDFLPLVEAHARKGHSEVEVVFSSLPSNPSSASPLPSAYPTSTSSSSADGFSTRNTSAAQEWVYLDPAQTHGGYPTLQVLTQGDVMSKLARKTRERLAGMPSETGLSPVVHASDSKSPASRKASSSSSWSRSGSAAPTPGGGSPASGKLVLPQAGSQRVPSVEIEVRAAGVRRENEFGLVETKGIDIVVMTVKVPK